MLSADFCSSNQYERITEGYISSLRLARVVKYDCGDAPLLPPALHQGPEQDDKRLDFISDQGSCKEI